MCEDHKDTRTGYWLYAPADSKSTILEERLFLYADANQGPTAIAKMLVEQGRRGKFALLWQLDGRRRGLSFWEGVEQPATFTAQEISV